jgi:Antibiotic biosynthesis monooxygenase
MTAFNVVRFRVKAGNEQRFIDEHRKMRPSFKGFLGGSLIQTGDQTFCIVGEWRNVQSLVAARPEDAVAHCCFLLITTEWPWHEGRSRVGISGKRKQ